jgi:hypothetical protein
LIDAGDAAALQRELLGEQPRSAADVQHPRARRHRLERHRVRRRVAQLQVVVRVGRPDDVELAVVEDVQAVQPAGDGGDDDVLGVPEAVDAADLVAVVRRDRHFDDPLTGKHQLDDHLGVEVKHVGVVAEGNLRQGGHAVGTKAGVELREA